MDDDQTASTATATPPPLDAAPDAPSNGARLRRRVSRRMLAGVCAGIAERLDIEVSLVRVAFVVLAFVWGLGVVVYVAMWALVPRAGDDRGAVGDDGEPTSSWLAFLLLGAVLVFGLLVLTSWWGGPRWGGGLGVLWAGVLVVLLAMVLRRPGPTSFGKVLAALALAAVSLAILLAGAFLALVALTGVPMSGGIGDRVYQPTTVAQVLPTYQTSIGNMLVDLRRVHFGTRTLRVTASVAVGVLTVEVPPGVVVNISAHSGIGNVTSWPQDLSSFDSTSHSNAQLDLTAETGVGQVRLIRASPG